MSLPKDQAVRDLITGDKDVTTLNKAQFVKAGAGAGKTTSIKERVLNLVSKLNTSPEKMVIITYTTKAANELMTRIREILESKLDLPNVENALTKLTEAKISTFHAFCYELLKEYPIEFCIDPELELADEKTTDIMLNNCFEIMLSEAYSDIDQNDDFKVEQQLFVDLLYEVKVEDLQKTFLSLYQNRDLKPVNVDMSELQDVDILVDTTNEMIQEIYHLTDELISSLKTGKESDKLYAHIQENILPIKNSRDINEFIDYVFNNPAKMLKKIGAKTSYNNPETLTRFKDLSGDIKTAITLIQNTNKINFYNRSLEIYPYFQHVVQSYKKLYGFIDFFDCLYLVKQSLENDEHLRKLVQDRFDIVIIDEFQDSDPMQASIAFNLAGDKIEKLFFVGDPKQSIYGFSRADISVYLEIMDKVDQMDNGEVLELTTNFRSSGGLLDFINSSFDKILVRSDDRKEVSVDYTSMDKSEAKKDAPFETLHLLVNHKLDSEEKEPNAAERRSREAFMVGKLIQEKISSEDLVPGDFLVLFRSGTAMEAYEDALRSLDIPVVNTKSKNFLKRNEVIDLLNLLALCAFPKGDNGKFYRYCIEQSVTLNFEETFLDEVLSSDIGFEKKFKILCNKAGFIELILKNEDDTYLQFIENLCSLARTELKANKYDIKKTFYNLFEKATNDSYFSGISINDEAIHLQPIEPNAVTLMTVHASKGLESKVVILSAYDANEFADKQYVNRKDNEILVETPFLSSKIAEDVNSSMLMELYGRESIRREEEEKRVLYVGVTRAEEQFILLSKKDSKNKTFIQTFLAANPKFKETKDLDFNLYESEYNSQEYKVVGGRTVSEITHHYKDPNILINNEGLSVPVTTMIEDQELFKDIDGRKNGQEFGTFTHLVMEYLCTIIFNSKVTSLDTNKLVDDLYIDYGVTFEGEYINGLKQSVSSFLVSDMAKEIISAKSVHTELPFVTERKYHGIIDLIIENDDIIKIIDFKSDLLTKKEDEIKEHYKKQIKLYEAALADFTDKKIQSECVYLFSKLCNRTF